MTLEPKYKYSSQILGEILSAIGAKMTRLVGVNTTIGAYSKAGNPIGFEDAATIIKLFGVKGKNAASAMCVSTTAGHIFSLKIEIPVLKSEFSRGKVYECPFGDTVLRFKDSLICGLCDEYCKGISRYIDENIELIWRGRLTEDKEYCIPELRCENPKDRKMPYGIRYRLMVGFARRFVDKNELCIQSLSRMTISVGKRFVNVIGPDASKIPSKAVENAGKYQGPIFKEKLQLGDSINDALGLIKECRETLKCKVKTDVGVGEAEITTTSCMWVKNCGKIESEFVETLCTAYTNGLLSSFGDYEIVNILDGGCHNRKICRQIIKTPEEKEIENKEAYEAILDEMVDAKTIAASAIVTTGGLPVVSKMEKDVDEKLFAELSATMIGAGGTAINELKTGTSDRVILESTQARVVIMRAGGEMLLVAMSHLKTKLGLVLLHMGRVAERIEGLIELKT